MKLDNINSFHYNQLQRHLKEISKTKEFLVEYANFEMFSKVPIKQLTPPTYKIYRRIKNIFPKRDILDRFRDIWHCHLILSYVPLWQNITLPPYVRSYSKSDHLIAMCFIKFDQELLKESSQY